MTSTKTPEWLEIFSYYDKRFAEAQSRIAPLHPADSADEIRSRTATILGLEAIPQPQIAIRDTHSCEFEDIRISALNGRSWPGCEVTALYFEGSAPGPRPTVVICCGHGAHGKRTPSYFRLGLLLARQGANVLIPDNLGQGERTPMGHKHVVRPFEGGFTLQGMIVRETMAWIDWLCQQPDVDPSRLAASGNSGGGTLTLFLAGLEERLQLLTSSGYPSSFPFIARKEKHLCSCNILTGAAAALEMWQIYGLFAPKPLFLFQGMHDNLFPPDLFQANASRVEAVYRDLAGNDHQFKRALTKGGHSWDEERLQVMAAFYQHHWDLKPPTEMKIDAVTIPSSIPLCHPQWPDDADDTDTVAARIAGIDPAKPLPSFEDLFPSCVNPQSRDTPWGRSTLGHITAQLECFLAEPGV